jgi:hypothetical protein
MTVEKWEDSVKLLGIIIVIIFIVTSLYTYYLLLFGEGNVNVFFPLQSLIFIVIVCWILMSILAIFYKEGGLISLILEILSIATGLYTGYLTYTSKVFSEINVSGLAIGDSNVLIVFFISLTLIAIGIVTLIYYTFGLDEYFKKKFK